MNLTSTSTPQSMTTPAAALLGASILGFACLWGAQFALLHHFAPEIATDPTSYWFAVALLSGASAIALLRLLQTLRLTAARVLRPDLPRTGFANQQLALVYMQARRHRDKPADQRRHLPTKEQLRLTARALQARGLGPYQSRP